MENMTKVLAVVNACNETKQGYSDAENDQPLIYDDNGLHFLLDVIEESCCELLKDKTTREEIPFKKSDFMTKLAETCNSETPFSGKVCTNSFEDGEEIVPSELLSMNMEGLCRGLTNDSKISTASTETPGTWNNSDVVSQCPESIEKLPTDDGTGTSSSEMCQAPIESDVKFIKSMVGSVNSPPINVNQHRSVGCIEPGVVDINGCYNMETILCGNEVNECKGSKQEQQSFDFDDGACENDSCTRKGTTALILEYLINEKDTFKAWGRSELAGKVNIDENTKINIEDQTHHSDTELKSARLGSKANEKVNCNPDFNEFKSVNSQHESRKATSFPFISLLIIVASVVLGPIREVEGSLTKKASDTVVQLETKLHLSCSTGLREAVHWERISFGSNEPHTIYFGELGMAASLDERFTVDKDPAVGRYDLVISNVKKSDAGTYICIDESGVGEAAQTEVVVAEEFNCEMKIPPGGFMGANVFGRAEDVVSASCNLRFHGNVVPRLDWSWPHSQHTGHSVVMPSSSTVESMLTLPATKELNGDVVKCVVRLSNGTGAPADIRLQWESPKITVKYALFNPFLENCCPGVHGCLICNPSCVYTWEAAQDDKCVCVSSYDEVNQYSIFISAPYCYPEDAKTNAMEHWKIIVAVIIAIILGIAVTGFSVAIIRRCRRKTDRPHVGIEKQLAGSRELKECLVLKL